MELFPLPLRSQALAALERASQAALRDGRPRRVAIAAAVPDSDARELLAADGLLRLFASDEVAAARGEGSEARFALFQPTREREWLGRGEVAAVEPPAGQGRRALTELPASVGAFFDGLECVGDGAPQLVGGLAYHGRPSRDVTWRSFGVGRLWLPRELWMRDGGRLRCVVAIQVDGPVPTARDRRRHLDAVLDAASVAFDPAALRTSTAEPDEAVGPEYCAAADRSHAAYRDGVSRALASIARGELEKVVIARSLRVRYANGPRYDCARLLRTLRASNPSCSTFAIARPQAAGSAGGAASEAHEAIFLGASPELLVRTQGDRVETLALAGSAPRGRSPQEDASLARALVESKKQQAEHSAVVRAIATNLAEHCDGVEREEAPSLLQLEGIQHLATPMRARRRGPGRGGLLAILASLHPTPAVSGTPRAAAEAWLEANEDLERGWYAGPVGVVGANGDGEFHVALRAGLVRGAEARLYAGAGIVEGSEPEAELAETRIKLRTLLAPLTEI